MFLYDSNARFKKQTLYNVIVYHIVCNPDFVDDNIEMLAGELWQRYCQLFNFIVWAEDGEAGWLCQSLFLGECQVTTDPLCQFCLSQSDMFTLVHTVQLVYNNCTITAVLDESRVLQELYTSKALGSFQIKSPIYENWYFLYHNILFFIICFVAIYALYDYIINYQILQGSQWRNVNITPLK